MLTSLRKISIKNPADKIIAQIRTLIISGEVKPGDKLPPERKLAEHFGVGRSQVRDALQKLEFYGIIKTHPQSGTFVTGLGIVALEGLITNILNIAESDFLSLVETRILLEKQATFLAAQRHTPTDLVSIRNAMENHEAKLINGESAIEEDLMFHLKIAEASKNVVLKSLMMIITPDIVKSFTDLKVCDKVANEKTISEHRNILEQIENGHPKKAGLAMEEHLKDVLLFSKSNHE